MFLLCRARCSKMLAIDSSIPMPTNKTKKTLSINIKRLSYLKQPIQRMECHVMFRLHFGATILCDYKRT